MTTHQTLLNWLQTGAVEQTLHGLRAICRYYGDKERAAAVISQISRYQTWAENKRKNLVSHADAQLELDRI